MDVNHKTPSDILPQVMDYKGPDRIVSSMEFLELNKPATDTPTFYSGMDALDRSVKGFKSGELIVISGPTAMGKTLLCDTMIRAMRTSGHFSLLFTFEVTPETVALSHNTPESVLFLPLQHVAMDLEWLRWRCLEAKMKFGCEAIFIDHLHYLIDMAGQHNISLEIGRVMRFLKKEIALAMNLAVVIVCHVKQLDLETDPSIYHLRDSSFVGQEADTVLMVWRRRDLDLCGRKLETMLQGLAAIKIEKARRSGVMGKKILIKKDGHKLVESLNEPEKSNGR
jgi:replicative DNA helicase